MALVIDESLPDGECWFRVLTNLDHITAGSTVHYQALKGRQFQEADTGKSWNHELSGRVVSVAGGADEIREEAERRIERIRKVFADRGEVMPSKICFAGIACASSNKLRTFSGAPIATDSMYTPIGPPDVNEDRAHSDFVTTNTSSNDDIEPVRHWLMKTLKVVSPSEIELAVASGELLSRSAG